MTSHEGLGERLLKPTDVADYLGVPLSTLHYWRRTGQGPKALQVGRLLRWEPDTVRQWRDAARGQAS